MGKRDPAETKTSESSGRGDPAHPQPSPNEYDAWVLSRLSEERGERTSTTAGWIITDWIERNQQRLADVYGITRDEYRVRAGLKPQDIKG